MPSANTSDNKVITCADTLPCIVQGKVHKIFISTLAILPIEQFQHLLYNNNVLKRYNK